MALPVLPEPFRSGAVETAIARELGLTQPPNGTATSVDEAARVAEGVGYPVLVRPSYVLGGRAMEIVYSREDLADFATGALLHEKRARPTDSTPSPTTGATGAVLEKTYLGRFMAASLLSGPVGARGLEEGSSERVGAERCNALGC